MTGAMLRIAGEQDRCISILSAKEESIISMMRKMIADIRKFDDPLEFAAIAKALVSNGALERVYKDAGLRNRSFSLSGVEFSIEASDASSNAFELRFKVCVS
jgi:hypothetical protein